MNEEVKTLSHIQIHTHTTHLMLLHSHKRYLLQKYNTSHIQFNFFFWFCHESVRDAERERGHIG